MATRPRAVLYLQPGTVPHARQAQFCLSFCEARGYHVVALVPPPAPGDAVRMVRDGDADLVVAAFASRGTLRRLALAADVQVAYVRPPRVRREVGEVIVRMYRNSGGDLDLVASMVGESPQQIRAVLLRMGIRVPRE